jgi:hypothetical protein
MDREDKRLAFAVTGFAIAWAAFGLFLGLTAGAWECLAALIVFAGPVLVGLGLWKLSGVVFK